MDQSQRAAGTSGDSTCTSWVTVGSISTAGGPHSDEQKADFKPTCACMCVCWEPPTRKCQNTVCGGGGQPCGGRGVFGFLSSWCYNKCIIIRQQCECACVVVCLYIYIYINACVCVSVCVCVCVCANPVTPSQRRVSGGFSRSAPVEDW